MCIYLNLFFFYSYALRIRLIKLPMIGLFSFILIIFKGGYLKGYRLLPILPKASLKTRRYLFLELNNYYE